MTERLSQLLHDEATHLAPPAPDLTALLADGRRQRRRQRVTTGLAVAAGVVAVAGTAVTLVLSGLGDRKAEPVAVDRTAIVWAYESDVHVGDVTASVPGTVLSLHHTSVGVLAVSTRGNAPLAEPGQLTLVRYDGTTEDLGELESGERPTTDPGRDFYLLTEERGADRPIVVRDAGTGEVRDEIDYPGSTSTRPPMAMDGNTAYLRVRSSDLLAVDLTTGESAHLPQIKDSPGEVTAGRTILGKRRNFFVADAGTGEELLQIPSEDVVDVMLSPNGAYASVVSYAGPGGFQIRPDDPMTVAVEEVATGQRIPLDIGDADAQPSAWTLSGDLYQFSERGVVRCEIPMGTCTEAALDDVPDLPEPNLGEEPLARIVLPVRP